MAAELYPIEVRVGARPISVAFVVPEDEDPKHHLMLDAAFAECYRRWGGAFSLMVPWTAAGGVPAKL